MRKCVPKSWLHSSTSIEINKFQDIWLKSLSSLMEGLVVAILINYCWNKTLWRHLRLNIWFEFLDVILQVSSPDHVLSLVKSKVKHSRAFALGIGSRACRTLVSGIADGGGGTAEYVDNADQLQSTILKQLKVALRPALLKPIRVTPGSSGRHSSSASNNMLLGFWRSLPFYVLIPVLRCIHFVVLWMICHIFGNFA